ncbi:hypothetical protein ACQP3L_31800, partial [Escherichia coli]
KILVDFGAAAKLTEKQLRSHKGEYMAIIKLGKWMQEDQKFKSSLATQGPRGQPVLQEILSHQTKKQRQNQRAEEQGLLLFCT